MKKFDEKTLLQRIKALNNKPRGKEFEDILENLKKQKRDEIVKNASLTILKKGGQGVLINDELIITAAHCIDFTCEGWMVLGDYFIEDIKTAQGELLKVIPLAVEPVNDIAVLGAMDNQVFPEESSKFEEFCENTKPVPLCLKDFELLKQFPICIYTHRGTFIKGRAVLHEESGHMLGVSTDKEIEGGTSGGPIVNKLGELVGVVSHSSHNHIGEKITTGWSNWFTAPRPNYTLPVWVYRRIKKSMRKGNAL